MISQFLEFLADMRRFVVEFFGRLLWLIREHFMRRGFPLFALISLCWMSLILIPYAVIGESWGMLWFLATAPLSSVFKKLWETQGVVVYVGSVTLIYGIAIFFLLSGLSGLYGRFTNTKPRSGSGQTAVDADKDDYNLNRGAM